MNILYGVASVTDQQGQRITEALGPLYGLIFGNGGILVLFMVATVVLCIIGFFRGAVKVSAGQTTGNSTLAADGNRIVTTSAIILMIVASFDLIVSGGLAFIYSLNMGF